MGGLFGGGGGKAPRAPAPIQPLDVIDFVGGVSQTIETRIGPDGKKRKVIIRRRLPQSAQERADEAKLRAIFDSNLANIEKLSAIDLAINIPEFQEAVTALRTNLTTSLDSSFKRRARLEEESLAATGNENSSASAEVRAERGKSFSQGSAEISRQTTFLAENLRNQSLNRSQNLLSLAAGRLDIQKGRVAQALQGASQAQQGIFNIQSANQTNQFNAQLQSFNAQQSGRSGFLSGITGLASLGLLAAGPSGFGLFGGGFDQGSGVSTGGGVLSNFFSDRRVKENIKVIGTLKDSGLVWYSYTYIGGTELQQGVIAQDVEKVIPEAIGNFHGILTVDYSKIK